ncbi:hypothetical protein PAXINDRAFT_152833 [Paxillus involutus ATCC 200175]|nr:hypothetical protein PAXINDRAFT_152833 [Paxillus involutus ATCC 200175]
MGYISDILDDESDDSSSNADWDTAQAGMPVTVQPQQAMCKTGGGRLPAVQPLKRRKLDILWRVQCKQVKAARMATLEEGLNAINKLSKRYTIDASERAAEAHGFAAQWGGHQWAIDPEKLVKFTKNELIPHEADKYARQITDKEMPCGLKQYMETELLPRIHLSVGRGVSLPTACRWLHQEGFRFLRHRKGLYFDGHDRPDVVEYRQKEFLPKMQEYEPRLVQHLVDAGQSLKYRKNHEGYWNSELFVKQLTEKIIPTFKNIHGPGYQALFLIDNSQGHSASAEDALVGRMRNGWFTQDGVRIEQPLLFPPDHPEFPDQLKGIKTILQERNL